MRDSDEIHFVTLLTGIADYYTKELAAGTIGLYWEGLRQYDLQAVEKALWAHTQNPDTGQFMPKIADVTKMLQGRTADQAAVAWSKVDAAVRRIGTYADVVFDDLIIHRVVADMGGWVQVGSHDEESWPFIGKEFMNRYRGFRERGEEPDYPPILIGTANAHNGKQGFRQQAPILIGHQERAAGVMAGGTTQPLVAMRPAGELAAPAGAPRIGRAA